MRKFLVTLVTLTLLFCTLAVSPASAADVNPFTNATYKFFVWDDLSGKENRQLVTPTSGSNGDIHYYGGNGQTIFRYQNERLRITRASGSQLAMLTTGRAANNLSTRRTEGYGCYISNQSGAPIVFRPLIVGDDFYQMRTQATAYLVNSAGVSTQVTSLSGVGGVEIPNGFTGHIAVPFTSLAPSWGNTSAFVPGTAHIGYFSVYIDATFPLGSAYVDIDNMFLYGANATANNQYLIKGGSSVIPLDEFVTENPFDDAQYNFFIWDDLSGVPNMNITLPAEGQENTYVKSVSGGGTHVYKFADEKLHIVGASDWKQIQLKTGHQATAAQTAGAEGFGFYVKNNIGQGYTLQPTFRGANGTYRIKPSSAYRIVDMEGWSYEDKSPDWGGALGVPRDFEGYILLPLSSLSKDGGGGFTPGTDSLENFSVNLYANFQNSNGRYLAFDNMFIYGKNLAASTPGAKDVLFPAPPTPPAPNTQEVAAPSQEGTNGNKLVGLDQFGRTVESIVGSKGDKDVGMFFFIALGEHNTSGIYDMTEFLKTTAGAQELMNPNSTVSPANQIHYWGQPLWGYYASSDEYVLRKQVEMMTLAGLDFVAFDVTNASTYPSVYTKLFKIMDEYQKEGWDVPKVAFFTHSISINTVKKLYYHIYQNNMYPDLWYYYKGKPMIIAYSEIMDDLGERIGSDFTDYYPTQLPSEIKNFFSFKYPQWPNEGAFHANGFPYVEWDYPQPVHNDVMSVSVASHHNALMSFTYYSRSYCWGRGYDFNTNQNVAADAHKGTFFQSQWNQAFKEDPDIVFVGGWNEWTGVKLIINGGVGFVDEFGMEFSRDIEPMKDGYEDAYYLQTIKNIRHYNGYTGKNYLSAGKTVNISGSVSQWNTGTSVYKSFGTQSYGRDSYDFAGISKYTQDAPRNNIQEIRVVNDNTYIYFYIMNENNITPYTGANNWMNLFIGTGNPSPGGWNGYDFVINRVVNLQTGKSDITALSSNFSGTKAGEADITVNGRLLMLRVPRSALGLSTGQAAGAQIYFKVADGVTNPASIQNYYTSGKSIPMGRLSYSYDGVKPTAIANAVNPITDPSVGIQVYEDFSGRANMELPLESQNQYFWEAPPSGYYKMSFYKQRLRITKAPLNTVANFMMHINSTAGLTLTGMEGIGMYVKNSTPDRIVVSPLAVGDHAFYMPKGATAKLINLGGNLSLVSDGGEFSDRSSFSIPAWFEGYITFNASDFICMWHGDRNFTAGNFSLGYFSLRINPMAVCSETTGNTITFDNLFFYGQGLAPYKQNLVKP